MDRFRDRIYPTGNIWLNKTMGCKSPRCRRCKCRDGQPLMKVCHWFFLRRQAGHHLRHKPEERKPEKLPKWRKTLGGITGAVFFGLLLYTSLVLDLSQLYQGGNFMGQYGWL